jgi:hypothetical protein
VWSLQWPPVAKSSGTPALQHTAHNITTDTQLNPKFTGVFVRSDLEFTAGLRIRYEDKSAALAITAVPEHRGHVYSILSLQYYTRLYDKHPSGLMGEKETNKNRVAAGLIFWALRVLQQGTASVCSHS